MVVGCWYMTIGHTRMVIVVSKFWEVMCKWLCHVGKW